MKSKAVYNINLVGMIPMDESDLNQAMMKAQKIRDENNFVAAKLLLMDHKGKVVGMKLDDWSIETLGLVDEDGFEYLIGK
jgi:hypothetical protein